MLFNATKPTADFVGEFEYDPAIAGCTQIYTNQEYYYNNNFTLKVFNADTNELLKETTDYTNTPQLDGA